MTGPTLFGDAVRVAVRPSQSFYVHGWHSWCTTGWVDVEATPHVIEDRVRRLGHADPVHAFDTVLGGSGLGMVDHGDGEVTLLGALGLEAWVHLDGDALVGSAPTPVPWFTATGPETEVLAAYTERLGKTSGRRGGSPPRVWCSWYTFYEDVDEATFHQVIEDLGDLPFDVVQIDDGWQQAVGDWFPNEDFPSGMTDLADRIRATGRTPGLWISPFVASASSAIVRDHSDLFLRDDDGALVVAGEFWGGPYHPLDLSNPTALDAMAEMIERAVAWGYDYLKLDFLYGAAFPGRQHVPIGREAAYRAGVERIRHVVGEERYLLACGAPVIASIGPFDGLRVGPDVAEYWYRADAQAGARNAIATSAQRLWLEDVVDIDPDVVFFRRRQLELDDRARRLLLDLASITRFRGVSDPPGWLDADDRADLHSFLTNEPQVAQVDRHRWSVDGRVVDFDLSEVPS